MFKKYHIINQLFPHPWKMMEFLRFMTIFLRWICEIRRQKYKSHISRIKSEKTIWFFLFENFNFLTNRITRMEISIKRKFRIFLYVKVIFIFIWIFQSLDGAYCRNGELQLKNNIEKKKKNWKMEQFGNFNTSKNYRHWDRVLNYSFIRKFQSFEIIVLLKYRKQIKKKLI